MTVQEFLDMGLTKRTVGAGLIESPPSAESKMSSQHELTHEFLTGQKWDDGTPRKTGTVMVLWEEGLWKAWVHDRAQMASAWVSGKTQEELWKVIERKFKEGSMEWRKTVPGKGQR
jgi:hypothetical protein